MRKQITNQLNGSNHDHRKIIKGNDSLEHQSRVDRGRITKKRLMVTIHPSKRRGGW